MDCSIINNHAICTSDHYPIRTVICLSVNNSDTGSDNRLPHFPRPDWNDRVFRQNYVDNMKYLLSDVRYDSLSQIKCKLDAQNFVNIYCNRITETIHDAVSMSNNSLPYSKKRKQFWWNNDCTLSRNRLKFWFSLWKSCSCPRKGPVYDSYKMAKQCFRKVCRTVVNSNVTLI